MSFIVTVGILLLAAPTSLSNYCSASCMVAFQTSISEITGSTAHKSQMAPFHDIIGSSTDNEIVYQRIRLLCIKVKHWEVCVRSCPRDMARSVLLSSMDQWKTFCAVMRKPTQANNEYLDCERNYQQNVIENCNSNIPQTYSVTEFCNSLETYRDCSARYDYQCTERAIKIKKELEDAILKTFTKLMKFATNKIRLPNKCKVFTRSHHYRRKQLRGEIAHSSVTLQALSSVVISTTTTSTVTPTTTTETTMTSTTTPIPSSSVKSFEGTDEPTSIELSTAPTTIDDCKCLDTTCNTCVEFPINDIEPVYYETSKTPLISSAISNNYYFVFSYLCLLYPILINWHLFV